MKAENDLPVTPAEEPQAPPQEDNARLFTDHSGDGGGESMLPGYDGAEPAPGATPEPFESKSGEKLLRLKMPNGNVFKGKTERELLEQIYRGKIAADEAIRDRELQIRDLQSRMGGPAAQPRQPAPSAPAAPVVAPGEEWDPQKYLTLLGEDPMRARAYQDRFMYGGLDPVQATNYAYQVAQRLDQQMVAASFHDRNPDFPISPENSAKLMGVLQSRGLQPNIVNLEWGYGELKRTGLLSPAGPGPAGVEDTQEYDDIQFGASAPSNAPPVVTRPAAPAPPQQPAGPQRRGGGAPPSPRNGGGNNTPDVIAFEDMTLEQIKEHARKVGVLKH